jgi:hypothetical protein
MLVVQYGQIPKKWESSVIWNKWRLVSGNELYDLKTDPGQQRNAAAENAAVLNRMKEHYEKWWAGVEAGTKEFEPISVGAPQENPVLLSSSDWQDIYADNFGHVSNAAGGARGGPWRIKVEHDGQYEIQLSRWPFEKNLPLTAGREEQRMTTGSLPAGKALPIAGARLKVADNELSVKTSPSDRSALFRATLKRGTTNLHAWFQDTAGSDLCGAFYASVKRV